MADEQLSLKAKAQARIEQLLSAMDTQGPTEQRATANAIESLSRSLAGLSEIDTSLEEVLRKLVTEAEKE